MSSPPVTKTPKSRLTAEEPSTERIGTYQKDILNPKTKKKPKQESKRGAFTIQSNLKPTGWVTHKLENNYTAEVLPQELEF